jgi:ribosomal-protein-alanine N-acetyltransferase
MPRSALPDGFETTRLVLRPIAPGDGGSIFDGYAQDTEVTRYLTWRPHGCREDTAAYIAHCMATPPTTSRTYALTRREDGSVLGGFDLRWPAPHRLEFGYVLARPYWGLGLMTETLCSVVYWALRQKDVFRIGSVCDVENTGSVRVMEKAGLVREGLLKRWLVMPNIGDEPRDCFTYAIVK